MTVRTTSSSDDWADLYKPPADGEEEAVLGLNAEGKQDRPVAPAVVAVEPVASRAVPKALNAVAPPEEEIPPQVLEPSPAAPARGPVGAGSPQPSEARRLTPQPMPVMPPPRASLPLRSRTAGPARPPVAESPAARKSAVGAVNLEEHRTSTSPPTGEQVRRVTGAGRTFSSATGEHARRLHAVTDAAHTAGSSRRSTTSMLRKVRPSVPQPDADGVVNLLLDNALKANVPFDDVQKLNLSTIEAYILWQLDGHRTIGETYQMMSHMDANDVRDVLLKLLDLGLVLPV